MNIIFFSVKFIKIFVLRLLLVKIKSKYFVVFILYNTYLCAIGELRRASNRNDLIVSILLGDWLGDCLEDLLIFGRHTEVDILLDHLVLHGRHLLHFWNYHRLED